MEPRTIRTNRNWNAAVLCAVWCLLLVQGSVLPVLGQDLPEVNRPPAGNKGRVVVSSDPPGQPIILDGRRMDAVTPADLDLNPGHYYILVNAEGYQPLNHDVAVATGEHMELEFILLKTPPEPPTPEELRAMSPPFGADDPNSDYWAEAGPREMANESCRECHPSILKLHAQGEHRTMSCEQCHGPLSDHVKDGALIGELPVVRGEGIQPMCMMCHDRNNMHRIKEPARTVDLRRHLQELRVLPHNRCEDCHHVHDPMKWVHEAREMVGIPEKISTIPMLDEKEAAASKRERYDSMAETFLVFPLAPGFLGMAVSEGEGEFPAQTFLISGMALVVGSYLLGGLAHSRELARTKALNVERRAVNAKVKEHNLRVENAMLEYSRAATLWGEESEGRGVVVVKER